ncbi:YfbM family protein [Streptomyces sp. NPDC088789]|uniref:YfbM family protein n=1 Tax=Streptomyces sp. NPDC088789 TaxID=3365899 RepID=UPI0038231BC1
MSMIGRYVRLTAAELDRALADPAWALLRVEELRDEEDEWDEEAPPREPRSHSTDKTWHALHFLLGRHPVPVDVVHGEEDLPGADDWGYGPPRYLTPDQVRRATEALAAVTPEALPAGARPADLAAAGVYPTAVWERDEPLDWVIAHYQDLTRFLRIAARYRQAVVVWVD